MDEIALKILEKRRKTTKEFPKHIVRNVFALLEAVSPIMHANDKNTKIYVEYFAGTKYLEGIEKMVEKLKGKGGGRRRRRKSRRKSKKRRKKTKKRRRKRRR